MRYLITALVVAATAATALLVLYFGSDETTEKMPPVPTAVVNETTEQVVTDKPKTDEPKIDEPKIEKKEIKKSSGKKQEEIKTEIQKTIEAPTKKKSQEVKIEEFREPVFDIVRFERDATAVMAGKAHPRSTVSVFANKKTIAKVKTDNNSEWLFVAEKPINGGKPGTIVFTLSARSEDGKIVKHSKQSVTVIIPEKFQEKELFVIKQQPGKPTEVLQKTTKQEQKKIRQRITIDTFDYVENTSTISVTGTAPPQILLKLYINNEFKLDAIADQKGEYKGTKKIEKLVDGRYTLRIDAINKAGKVVDRIEVSFVKKTKENIEIQIVRGDNLWNIARKLYGSGFQYTVIYEANKDDIKDPDLIYPGQVFVAPRNINE